MSASGNTPCEDAHLSRAARVGAAFDATVSLPDGFEAGSAEGLAELSLSFDPHTLRVSGTPSRQGSFDILVHGTTGKRKRMARFTLPISPDPSSLWKNLPSDQDAAFAHPDTECEVVDGTSQAAWICASSRGRRHAHKGDYRDDAYSAITDPESGWHIAAVADGAGSAPLSREGAHLAVTTVTDTLPAHLTRNGCRGSVAERDALLAAMTGSARLAVERIEAIALQERRPVSDFSTTLLIGAVRRVEDHWFIATFSIGDGLMAVWDTGSPSHPAPATGPETEASSVSGKVTRLCAQDSGEFAGETLFLDSRLLDDTQACAKRLFINECDSLDAFALMSDGVSDPQFQSSLDEISPATWARLWSEIWPALDAEQPAEALLRWLDFHVPGEHDDRTLVVFRPDAARSQSKP